MRRTLVGIIAALALGSVSPAAFAADMVPEPAPVASWTGFYIGAGGGVGWADLSLDHKTCVLYDEVCSDYEDFNFRRNFDETGDGTVIGIVQGGFDYELAPSFVVGVFADATFGDLGIDRNNNDDHFFDSDFRTNRRFETNGGTMVDVAGRAGFAPAGSNFLVYGLVGWTWADIDTNFRLKDVDNDINLFHNDDNFSANGLTFGGGVEWKFTENLSVRGEYRFTDLDNFGNNGRFDCDWCDNDSFKSRNDIDLNVQRVLFTLNWRFGGYGATTAAAY